MISVRFITSKDDVALYWEQVVPLLEMAIPKTQGEFDVSDIRRGVEAGHFYVAMCEKNGAPELAMAFEFRHYPRYMTINVMAMGGKRMGEFAKGYWKMFLDWSRSAGAEFIEADGSKEMARLLKRVGFDVAYQRMRVKL